MPSYKDRVAKDLDGWIAAGLAPESSRAPILASIPEGGRLDAAAAMAWVGAVLLGLAVMALIAANWDLLPRLAQFALVLGVFGAFAGAAAWCAERARPNLANGLLTVAALAFASAVGLTGQIFDITGNERVALYLSGVVAAALALAGRSSGAMVLALAFIGLGDDWRDGWNGQAALVEVPWLAVAAPAAAALALRWRSTALAHAAAIAVVAEALWLAAKLRFDAAAFLAGAVALAVLAIGARWLARRREDRLGGVFYGWFVWGAFAAFIAAGIDLTTHRLGVLHRIVWLAAAGGALALGRNDRHTPVTAAGVLGLIGAVSVLMLDLGVNLLTAAAVFFVAAAVALVAGLILRRRAT